MPKRKIYTVSKSKDGGWEAKETGGGLVASGDRKPEVVRAVVKEARSQDLGFTPDPTRRGQNPGGADPAQL
jgi:hypothetical protein